MNTIPHFPTQFLEKIELIDIYQGEKVQPDFKNVTLRFIYRDLEKNNFTEYCRNRTC